jgi:hypothetical protein
LTNSPVAIAITLSITSTSISGSLNVGANLASAAGDLDLGSTSALPINQVSLQTVFSVPVKMHTAGAVLGAAAFEVVYDPARLTLVSVQEGSGWAGGTFEFNERYDPTHSLAFS